MIPTQITEWAKRFVCGNELESVQRHIKLLAASGEHGAMLIEAIQQVLDGLKPDGFGGSKFGHDRISEARLPLVSRDGFFLRTTNTWTHIPANYEDVVQFVLADDRFQTVTIDHIDNLFYSNGTPYLFPNRSVLSVCKGWREEQAIWHAQSGRINAWTVRSAAKSYIDYWDHVGGVEGTIREDFILNESDIQELVKAFLNEESPPKRFKSTPAFIGFHPEIAMEYLEEFGEEPLP